MEWPRRVSGYCSTLYDKYSSLSNVVTQSIYDKSLCDDIVHVAVVLKKGHTVTRAMITDCVRSNLPEHMHITGDVVFMDAIPHNPIGKKLRRNLKKMHMENKLPLLPK